MNGLLLLLYGAAVVIVFALSRAFAATPPKAEFEQRFAPVHATVLDTDGAFSYSETYPKLEAIEQLARRIGADSPERARVLDLMSLVRFKHGDYAEALLLGDACLALTSASAIVPADRILLMHRVATSAENMERYDLAVSGYRTVLDFDASAKGSLLTDAQRLGVREHIGFLLHEDKEYAQALASNRATLAEAERIFGPNHGHLTTILTNLAQNTYELGQFAEAQATLQRSLGIARGAGKDDMADEMLFQLGVLAFERGDVEGARSRMKERLQTATDAHDDERIAHAQAAAAELEHRIASRQ
jgi:tetratricopeptide (TPR) repeat protein